MPAKKGKAKKAAGAGEAGSEGKKSSESFQPLPVEVESVQLVRLRLQLVHWKFHTYVYTMRSYSSLYVLMDRLRDDLGAISDLQIFLDPSRDQQRQLNDPDKSLQDYGLLPAAPGEQVGEDGMGLKEYNLYFDFKPKFPEDPLLLSTLAPKRPGAL